MNEQSTKNLFSANSLRQKLHRLNLSPTRDQVGKLFAGLLCSGSRVGELANIMAMPYDPKVEQRVIDEFLASSAVYHEKIRRQISSVECEIASVREAVAKKTEEGVEKKVVISDLRHEVSELFDELQYKKDQCVELKIKHDVIMNDLVHIQDKFSPPQVSPTSGPLVASSLDGMRRNIIRLLHENKELVNQQRFMAKQLQLFGLRLKATNIEISKTHGSQQTSLNPSDDFNSIEQEENRRGLLSRSKSTLMLDTKDFTVTQSGEAVLDEHERSFLREAAANVKSGATACNMYHALFPTDASTSAELTHRRSRILHLLGRDFYANWKDAQTMFSLSEALQYMESLRNIDQAVQFVMSAICKLCECDRASYWVVDKQKGIAWTKVPSFAPAARTLEVQDVKGHRDNIHEFGEDEESEDTNDGTLEGGAVNSLDDLSGSSKARESPNMTTLMIPINTGLVGAAFKTGKVINIADAYADARFNRMVDLKTEYRTKSVLCYPIVYHDQVLGVCQCINKISPSASVFSAADIETVKTLGSSMLTVLSSCHGHEESKRLAERRMILVSSIGEIVRKMNSRKDLVVIVRETLRKIFKAHDTSIVLVYKDFYAKISIDFDGTISLVESDRDEKSGGLIHACTTQREPLHVFGRSVLSAWKNRLAKVDLDVLKTGCLEGASNLSQLQEGDVSVHCIPLFSPSHPDEISAVIQWVCLDRSVIGFGDDGSFDENNAVHVDMVERLMRVVGFHVERFWPSKYRLLWTKAKHLQLKIRGMISFSTAARNLEETSRIANPLARSTPPPTNRRVIDMWIKAKNLVLERNLMNSLTKEDTSQSNRRQVLKQSTAEFMDQMVKERGSLAKRSTVTINPNALEEILAASNFLSSPFAKNKNGPRLGTPDGGEQEVLGAIQEASDETDSSSGDSEISND